MAKIQRLHSISMHPQILLISLLITLNLSFAYDTSPDIPENAHPKKYGSGWECERGFRAVGESCEAVAVPDNAHLDYSGNRWECNPPYVEHLDECI